MTQEQMTPAEQAFAAQYQEQTEQKVAGILGRAEAKIRAEQEAWRKQQLEEREAMRAEFAAAVGTAAKPSDTVDVDKLKADLRAEAQAEMRTVLNNVAATLPPEMAAKLMEAAPAAKPSVVARLNQAVFGSAPLNVPFTKREALEELKKDQPSDAVVAAGERGLHAIGIKYAFDAGLITPPRKGLETWQIVALSVGAGAVVVGAGVAGKMVFDAYKEEKAKANDAAVDGVIVF